MRERRVVLAPEAADDLNELYDWIAAQTSHQVAMGYLDRVEAFCGGLSIGSERRLTVAFTVGAETVTVLRVFTAGRDWEASF